MTDARFDFGPFQYDSKLLLLMRAGAPVPLGRRAALVLGELLNSRGAVIDKDRLLDAAWPGEIVEESNLSVQISNLRRAIGAQWIRTIERVGYQFVAATAPQPMQRPRVAILAFEGDEELAPYFAEALTEGLMQISAVAVAAGAPEDAYHVGGSVREVRGRWIASARLVRGDTYLWSSTHEIEKPSTSKIARMARRIAAEVGWRADQAEMMHANDGPSAETDIRALYLKARRLSTTLDPADTAQAIALLDRALDIEPDNVLILAAACEARHHHIAMGTSSDSRAARDCAALARRGLQQPGLDSAALAAFGIALYRALDRDWGLALTRQAARQDPNSFKALSFAGNCLMHWGHVPEAEASYRQALRLTAPVWERTFVLGGLSRIAMMEGRYEEAINWATQAHASNPNYGGAYWTQIAAHAQLGRLDRAAAHLERFREIHPRASLAAIRGGQPTRDGRMDATLDGMELAGLA